MQHFLTGLLELEQLLWLFDNICHHLQEGGDHSDNNQLIRDY